MGSVCNGSSGDQDFSFEPLNIRYSEDPKQNGIANRPSLVCNSSGISEILNKWTKDLNDKKTLYKDPQMLTDPIILKSRTQQIPCTYQRPYKFIEAERGQAYRLVDQKQEGSADYIKVNDQVMQYFGVFLCFLADKPNLIKKIITTEQNGYGFHAGNVYYQNKMKNFVIDDYILCKDGHPVFSQPYKMKYMWTCLLEKAWLKIKGSAAKRVEHNDPEQIFNTFLPIPIQKIYLLKEKEIDLKSLVNQTFHNYDKAKKKGYILTSRKNPQHSIGLSGRKHYYLLDTFIEGGKKLFYIHNPCGQENFRGFYKEVPESVESVLNNHGFLLNDSGSFILDEDEFIQQIDQITVIHYVQGNKITNYPFTPLNDQFFIGFVLKHHTILNLCLTQTKQNNKEKAYSPLMYHVIRISQNRSNNQILDRRIIGGLKNQQGCFGVRNTYLIDNYNQEVLPGKYLIRLKKKDYQRSLKDAQFYLNAYCKETITFEIVNSQQRIFDQKLVSQKWREFLMQEGHRKLEEDRKNQKTQKNTRNIAHTICWLGDIVFIYIEKKNQKFDQIQIQVSFPELMNLYCISHTHIKKSNQYTSLCFKDREVIVFEKINLTEQTYIRKYHLEEF